MKAFNYPLMPTIRLNKTPELEIILNEIRITYPLLDDADIIKMAISKYYSFFHAMPTRQATSEEEEAIAEGLDDMKNGRYKVIRADEPIDLDHLLNGV